MPAMIGRPLRFIGVAMAATMTLTAMPASAQEDSQARIRKLEAEVRALQRRVFPGSEGRYFEPEIAAQPSAQGTTLTTPSTTAVTDILARLDALETQLQRLTGQYEENANAMRQLTERVETLEARPAATTPEPAPTEPEPARGASSSADRVAQATGARSATPDAGPSAERIAAVQAIAKPQTDDPADDEYSYGFRLWDAGFYPEAVQQLTMFVEQHPDHWRATYGRNLLGRAYLDDGRAAEAAPWFLRNYQADKSAARAGDSLLYLAESMIALEDTDRACIALAEFAETYPALATGRLQGQYAANRAKVTCN